MKVVSGEQLHRDTARVSEMASHEPVAIDDRLVLLSMNEFQRLKRRDRTVFRAEDLDEALVDQIARTEMDPRHADLDKLMD